MLTQSTVKSNLEKEVKTTQCKSILKKNIITQEDNQVLVKIENRHQNQSALKHPEESYFDEGQKAFRNEMFPEAIKFYSEAIKLSPRNVKYFVARFKSYVNLEKPDYDSALKEALKIHQLDQTIFNAESISLNHCNAFAKLTKRGCNRNIFCPAHKGNNCLALYYTMNDYNLV